MDGESPGGEVDARSPRASLVALIAGRLRFSIADGAMFVLAAASASALFAKIHAMSVLKNETTWKFDSPTLVLLAIVLTAVALGAYKAHSAAQVLLQVTLGCLGYLSLLWLFESDSQRMLVYWFQSAFAVTVAGPMLARRFVKSSLPMGARRDWWKKTLEAVVFSFFNVLLVALGAFIQWIVFMIGLQALR